jgi:hypothetical protein
MAFTSTNRRIIYATQGVALGDIGATGVIQSWGTSSPATISGSGNVVVMHGVQSIGINTSFSLDPVRELGQLSIYENVEEVPDIEATIEKVLDGYTLAYHASTVTATDPTLTGRQNARADLRMVIGDDTNSAISTGDSLTSELYCSGMYWSSLSYTMPTDGNFTESLKLVGNNKKWLTSGAELLLGVGGTVSSVFDFGNDSPDSPDSGVMRRNNFVTGSGLTVLGTGNFVTVLPSFIEGISDNGSATGANGSGVFVNCGTIDNTTTHIQSISFSVDVGRDAINQLGTLAPYYRYINFPVTVSTEIEVIATGGDNIDAVENLPSGGNLSNNTIQVVLQDSTVIQVGNKNKITSVTYGGGDAGGGNAAIKYSLQNNNDFVVLHSGDPINMTAANYFLYWFT